MGSVKLKALVIIAFENDVTLPLDLERNCFDEFRYENVITDKKCNARNKSELPY